MHRSTEHPHKVVARQWRSAARSAALAAVVAVSGCSGVQAPPTPDPSPQPAQIEIVQPADPDHAPPQDLGADTDAPSSAPAADGDTQEPVAASAGGRQQAQVAYVDPAEVTGQAPPAPGWSPPQAGSVPLLDAAVAAPWWVTGQRIGAPVPEALAGALPGATWQGQTPAARAEVVEWAQGCVQMLEPLPAAAQRCAAMLHDMVWALDYLGASPQCVLEQYTVKAQQILWSGHWSGYGWHRCATVINPDPSSGTSLEVLCLLALPADVSLEPRVRLLFDPESFVFYGSSDPQYLLTCNDWSFWERVASGGSLSSCRTAGLLAEQWMQHYYFAPADGTFHISC